MANRFLALTLGILALAAQADTRERTTSYVHDATGLLTFETREPTNPDDCLQSAYEYDLRGNRTKATTTTCLNASGPTLLSATAPRGLNTGYDAEGRFATSSTNALVHAESRLFDARFGTVTSLTGPNGLSTTWSYDSLGRKTLETRSDGGSTTWTYKLCTDSGANCPGAIGGAASVWLSIEQSYSAAPVTANAPEKRLFYDSLNRVVRVQTQGFDLTDGSAPALVQDTTYNQLGQIGAKSDVYLKASGITAAVWTTYTYDVLGRVTLESRSGPAGVSGTVDTATAYNGASVTVTNANLQTKTTIKNALEQVARVIDAKGSSITYAYDALGNLLATKAAADPAVSTVSSTTSMKYDVRGNKLFMLDPAMGDWEYRYNAYGELVYQRDSLNQASTMVYDVLGRMTKRTEPDLVSQWSYDKYFDLSLCGNGKGKLCEAKADNQYNRKLSYDGQGRVIQTATLLDVLGTMSQTYDTSARVATRTWPGGYVATNTYTTLGYLKSVTGAGAQNVAYNVLTMNAHGQVTKYSTGIGANEVTTDRSFDPRTDALAELRATKGTSIGNVLNHSYTYDKLGNLVTRADSSGGVVGTAEIFLYDSLNRLTSATVTGGGGNGNAVTEVMYDPLGNITYKSDVGRFWYDAARPNRMTNVTLEVAPGATAGYFKGTRALSYAFDDYRQGARTVSNISGVTVGNGNLEYSVTHDSGALSGFMRHNVRWEKYTSFNMPDEIIFGNLVPNFTCPTDKVMYAGGCVTASPLTQPTITYSCTAGTLSGPNCVNAGVSTPANTSYTCQAGYIVNGVNCVQEQIVVGPTPPVATYVCVPGATPAGANCVKDGVTTAAILTYTCPDGQAVVGRNVVDQGICVISGYSAVAATQTALAERVLRFVYGPEHQRIAQTVAFPNGGQGSTYFPGKTWYLNGDDSLGMTFEREVRTNGTTENKHYVSANGVVFAIVTTRSGGSTASTASYLHLDHLGSVAAITAEKAVDGALQLVVEERLAYDPWGKRRKIMSSPGAADNGDELVGNKTDRGYTMHEHLDEMGVIHMNGRIYDPLVARFMSADPVIQNPYNLKSFNRYSYVWNNPLKYWDPDGYEVNGDPREGEGAPGGAANLMNVSLYSDREVAREKDRISEVDRRLESDRARSLFFDMFPVVGSLKALVQFFTEKDMSTGEKVSRSGEIIGIGLGVLGLGGVSKLGEVVVDIGRAALKGVSVEMKFAKEGIYEFKDGIKTYCGQSCDIPGRLQQHINSGKLTADSLSTVQTTEVLGGKTAREIAEHQRIQEITGGVPARFSDRVSNKRDPIGLNRRSLLND